MPAKENRVITKIFGPTDPEERARGGRGAGHLSILSRKLKQWDRRGRIPVHLQSAQQASRIFIP